MVKRPAYRKSILVLLLGAALTAGLAGAAPAKKPTGEISPTAKPLPERFATWLEEVEPLISARERKAFLALDRDYQREAFIQRFWASRDPYPQTARNELRERWTERVDEARSRFGSLNDDRARIYLVHGEPQTGFQVRCTTTRIPAEVWAYPRSDRVDFGFLVVFLRPNGLGPAHVYRPGASFNLETVVSQARNCINGERLAQVINYIDSGQADYVSKLAQVLAKPRPRSEEWLDTFAAYSTDVPSGAATFAAHLDVEYPGRHDTRTVLQAVISVPVDQVQQEVVAGHHSYELVINGDVVRDGHLFESFRYRFGFPADGLPGRSLPLAFHRYLRPGDYTLVVRVEDLASGRFFRTEEPAEVPLVEREVPVAPTRDPEAMRLFQEATAAMAAGETSIRIVPPRGDLQTGFQRVDTLVTGSDIDRVRFYLDGQPVMTKTRPPFNVELDLGEFPRRHRLRVEALNAQDSSVAEDETELNGGGNRFAIRLVEPRRGHHYERSLEARAEIQVPSGRSVDRVELYLDEDRVATLYQPPYTQPLLLPKDRRVSYVRAVAYLPDGNSTEDVVFLDSPEFGERLDVQFVELYASVLDGSGRPVRDLSATDFKVSEDGIGQHIARFERVEDLPIHAGILIDNSGSMRDSLRDVRTAALSFLEDAIHPKDRAAIITFNKFPTLAVKLTSDMGELGGGLAGLTAEGETSLYDSLIFALYYFTGIRGQRAILLLTDGKDESSRFSFDEALEYARRAGVTVYAIGLGYDRGDARGKLTRLADETGGRSFFIRGVDELPAIYASIEEDLRSQYLIAYQSNNTDDSETFRSVDVQVDRPHLKVKTIRGYYP